LSAVVPSVLAAAASLVVACGPPVRYRTIREHLAAVAHRAAYRSFVLDLDGHSREAAALVRRAFGVPTSGGIVPIVLTASDVRGDPFKCRAYHGSHMAYASHVRRGGGVFAEKIVFCLDHVARSTFDPRMVLRHELVHVVVSQVLGAYRSQLPRWFEEGLAEHVSGKGHQRVRQRLARSPADPLASLVRLRTLDDGGKAALRGRYHVAYLAVRALLERAGAEALPRLVKKLSGGASFWSALGELARGTRDELLVFADATARSTLTGLALAGGRDSFLRAQSALRTHARSGIASMEAFLAANEGSPYEISARLALARAHLRSRNGRAALAETSRLMRAIPHATPATRILHARALFRVGQFDEALRLVGDLVDSPATRPKLRAAAERLIALWKKLAARAKAARTGTEAR
jgi:hypothetical protein